MRILCVLCFVFILFGCGTQSVPLPQPENVPKTVRLQNENGREIGFGIHFRGDVFVAPDHLLQNGDLFVDETLIEIVARDFDHDVLFFRFDESFVGETVFSENPPAIGKTYYRSGGTAFQTLTPKHIGGDFSLGGESEKMNLIVFEGIINPGESGMPVFDLSGKVYSMLIAADLIEGISYGVRSDVLLELYRDQLAE